jgi:CDGSH-type Zn-finger protein
VTVPPDRTSSPRAPEITIYPDGPMLLRGEVEIVLPSGDHLKRRRRVIALCRCGHSALSPLCDGTHKQLWRRGKQSDLRRGEIDADD